MLEADGWDVVGEVADGQGAIDAVRTVDADVVLLDVGLPDISGLEVARQLRDQRRDARRRRHLDPRLRRLP